MVTRRFFVSHWFVIVDEQGSLFNQASALPNIDVGFWKTVLANDDIEIIQTKIPRHHFSHSRLRSLNIFVAVCRSPAMEVLFFFLFSHVWVDVCFVPYI